MVLPQALVRGEIAATDQTPLYLPGHGRCRVAVLLMP